MVPIIDVSLFAGIVLELDSKLTLLGLCVINDQCSMRGPSLLDDAFKLKVTIELPEMSFAAYFSILDVALVGDFVF